MPPDFHSSGLILALMPGEGDGGQGAPLAVLVGRAHRGGRDFRVRRRTGGFDGQRGLQLQGPKRQVVPMAAQIAHGAVAKIPPTIPFGTREINRVERPLGSWPEPEIPIESGGHWLGLDGPRGDPHEVVMALRVRFALPTPGPRNPHVRLRHRADGAALDQFHHLPVILGGVNLDSHLGGDFRFSRRLPDAPRLPDAVRQRFFAIDVFAMLERQHGRECVGVLAGANDDSVEVTGALEEFAEIGEFLRARMFRGGGLEVSGVDIAKGHDVFGRNGFEVAGAAPARANNGQVQFLIQILSAQERGRGPEGGGGRGQDARESPAGEGREFHTGKMISAW